LSDEQLRLELDRARETIRDLHDELQRTNSEVLQLTLDLEGKVNEQALLAAENRRNKNLLEAIFEADPAGLAVVAGPELGIVYANPAYRFIAPHNGVDLIGQPYAAVWSVEASNCFANLIRQVVDCGQPFQTLDFERHFPDGALRNFTVQARRIEWDLGQPAALIAMWDTSERKLNEQRLQRSEAKYRELADSITDPFTAWDANLRCIYRNKASGLATQVPDEQAIGKGFAELYPNLTGSKNHQAMLVTLASRQSQTLQIEWVRPTDGHRFFYDLSLYPTSDGLTAFSRDITEKKEAEQKAAEQEERFRITIASIGDAVITTDPNERITLLNPIAEQLTGWTGPEAIGQPLDQIFVIINEQTQQPADDPVRKVLKNGSIAGLANHTALISKDGRVIPIEDSAAPIRNADGQMLGVVMVFHDVTAKRKAEQALKILNDQLEERVATRTAELRTALQAAADSEERYRTLFESMDEGFCVVEVIFDNNEKPTDYRFLEINPAFERQSGIENAVGRWMREIAPQHEEHWFDILGKIALTGEAVRFENRAEQLQRYFDVFAFRVGEPSKRHVAILFNDITKRKQTELALEALNARLEERVAEETGALRESEERFRLMGETLPFGVWLSDPDGGARYTSPSFLELLDMSMEEAQQYGWTQRLVSEDVAPLMEGWGQSVASGADWEGELRIIDRYGKTRTVLSRGRPVRDERGRISCWVGIHLDITERKKTEEQIALQSAALAATANGVVITDRDGAIEWANPAFLKLTGYTLQEAAGKNPRVLVRSGVHDRAYFQNLWETILAGQVWRGEIVNRRKDGSRYTEEMTITPVCNEKGEINHFIAVKQDITARTQAEAEVHARNIRVELQHRLLEQREQERLQIARDIHDGPVQELIAASMHLEGMILDCPDPNLAEAYEAIKANLQAAVAELRGYAQDLRPPVLSKFGLANAIQAHLEAFQEKHPELTIQYEANLAEGLLSESVRVALYRIYQETLNNILKHARATQISIRLDKSQDEVSLEIQDNGIGFEIPRDWLELARRGHLGLVGMRERAEAIGGQLEIKSTPGEGTIMIVNIPSGSAM
jgi:PAS domain S-box-containing protein